MVHLFKSIRLWLVGCNVTGTRSIRAGIRERHEKEKERNVTVTGDELLEMEILKFIFQVSDFDISEEYLNRTES